MGSWRYYLQEALGLAIFMISACFFGAVLYSKHSPLYSVIESNEIRNFLMGSAMGATALFIFYSRWTAPSGSQINPAVTITFLRLKRISGYDAMFYVMFQLIGACLAVVLMKYALGKMLIDAPVNTIVTVPGKFGVIGAAITELAIAFITMSIVLFTSESRSFKKYTRVIVACLVALWVIIASSISGFGMNPARSLASAIASGIWTSFWIYLFIPCMGMLMSAELFLYTQRKKRIGQKASIVSRKRKSIKEPLEFVL